MGALLGLGEDPEVHVANAIPVRRRPPDPDDDRGRSTSAVSGGLRSAS
ncbi:hypothetical protein TOK_2259 [Pseudonocardia sp. N23]|nr:hypothetical protein TOK_2259 [Pseudonocardia sp. N23]